MPPLPMLADPLKDDRVAIRDTAERDIPEILIAYEDDPELHIRLGQERPPSGAQLGSRAENEPANRAAGSHATLTILERPSDDFRGEIYVHHLDWDNARAELAIWLAPQARGRGLAAAALRLVAVWLLTDCDLHRVQILTEQSNQAMIRAAEAAGFKAEGVLRAYTRERGARPDVAVLSRVREDLRP